MPRHVVLVSPNNPDGRVVPLAAVVAAAELCRARGGWLVVDQSFVDVAPEASVAEACATGPVAVLRSFGKFFGLAGLRLGFVLAPPTLARLVEAALGPWAVPSPALVVGAAALADVAWSKAMRATLAQRGDALDGVLDQAGLEIVGGTSLYRLVRTGDAAGLHRRLAGERIWVRRFDWSGELLRFGLPPDARSLARLAAALARATGGEPGPR